MEKLYPCGDDLSLEVSFREAFGFLISGVSGSARSSTAMRAVLGIPQSAQCRRNTSRAGAFQEGITSRFPESPY